MASTETFDGAVPWGRAHAAREAREKAQARAGGPKAEVDRVCRTRAGDAMTVVGFRHDETLASGERVRNLAARAEDEPVTTSWGSSLRACL